MKNAICKATGQLPPDMPLINKDKRCYRLKRNFCFGQKLSGLIDIDWLLPAVFRATTNRSSSISDQAYSQTGKNGCIFEGSMTML